MALTLMGTITAGGPAASLSTEFVTRARLSDIDCVASAVRCDLTQLAPGGEAEMSELQLVSGSLQSIRSTFSLVTRGDRPPGFVTFVRTSSTPGLVLNGQAAAPHQIWTLGPGAEVHGVLPPQSELTLLAFPERVVAASEGHAEPGRSVRGAPALGPSVSVAATIESMLTSAFDLARRDPVALRDEVRRWHIEEDLVESLRLVADAGAQDAPSRWPASVSRSEVIRVVEANLATRRTEPLRVTDLCDACGVSERTLRNVFYETYDMSPMRFLRLRRLNAARRDLRRMDPEEMTVAAVALRWGFWHPGAFSVLYRATFGERPSETLRRR